MADKPTEEKPSITANSVVEGMRAVSRSERYRHLVPEDAAVYYRIACEYCRQGNALMAGINAMGPDARLALLDKMAWEGLGVHYALRKSLIEQQTRTLIEEKGVKQVIIVGAGYDGLALRLHKEYPGVDFFEVDRPVMHERKQDILKLGRQKVHGKFKDMFYPERNLHFLSADLAATPLNEVLQNAEAFDRAKPSLFIAEGVTLYLTPEVNKALFEAMHQSCEGQAYALFGALDKIERHRLGADTMMKKHKEKYQWAVAYDQMPAFLEEAGLKLLGAATYQDLQRTTPDQNAQRPLRSGAENARIAELAAENYYLTEIMPPDKAFEQPDIHSVQFALPTFNSRERR